MGQRDPRHQRAQCLTLGFRYVGDEVFDARSHGGPANNKTGLQRISNGNDHGRSVAQAVEAPRIHHQWMPDTLSYERNGLSPDTAAILKKLGHVFKERASYEGSYQGDAETIAIAFDRVLRCLSLTAPIGCVLTFVEALGAIGELGEIGAANREVRSANGYWAARSSPARRPADIPPVPRAVTVFRDPRPTARAQ